MRLKPRVPLGVVLIASFYVFGVLVLVLSLVTNPQEVSRQIAQRQGLPSSWGMIVLPLTAVLVLVLAYGLYSLSRWGFALTLLYLTYIGSVSFFLGGQQGTQPYLGNLLWSLLVVSYLLLMRKRFFGTAPG